MVTERPDFGPEQIKLIIELKPGLEVHEMQGGLPRNPQKVWLHTGIIEKEPYYDETHRYRMIIEIKRTSDLKALAPYTAGDLSIWPYRGGEKPLWEETFWLAKKIPPDTINKP